MLAVKLWTEPSSHKMVPPPRNEYCRAKKSHKPRNATRFAVVEVAKVLVGCGQLLAATNAATADMMAVRETNE